MPNITISLSLTFTTPPSVGAGGVSGTLADKVVTRNARNQFIIPASQVKGKLRHACEQLLRAQGVPLCYPPHAERMCPQIDKDDGGNSLPQVKGQPCCLLCQIFGSSGYPSRLRFHDLLVKDANLLPEETLRWMISINRRRRTAEAQRLFVVETAPHFDKLQFENAEAITGRISDERHVHLLFAGLRMLFAWGGGTSHGLGWGKVEATAHLGEVEVSKFDKEALLRLCEEVKALCQSFKSL